MGRSLKKGPFVDHFLLKEIEEARKEGKKGAIKTYSRRSVIIPDMVGLTIEVHNGKKFYSIFVSESMVDHKLGEFSPTRQFKSHTKK